MKVLARHLGTAPKEWLLTYLDELLSQAPGFNGIHDVSEHIGQTFQLARQWMTLAEQTELEAALARQLNGH